MITRAGWTAAARRPPLIRLTCLRIMFIAEIGAPEASNARLRAISSSRLTPSGGAGKSAEPPPVISAITRSSSVSPETIENSALEAASPASSGTGCAASITLILRQGAP